MQPISPVVPGLEEYEVEYAKNQPEYITLPAYREKDGCVTTRWRLSWAERLRILWTGDIWHQVLTFNHPLQPVKLMSRCPISVPFIYQAPDEDV